MTISYRVFAMLGNIHTNVAIVVPNYKWVLGLHAGDGLYPLMPDTDLHSDASTGNVVVHGVGSLQPWAHKGHHLSHSQYVSINPYFHIFRFYHLYFLLAECLCRVSRPLMPSSMLHLPLVNVLFLAFHPSTAQPLRMSFVAPNAACTHPRWTVKKWNHPSFLHLLLHMPICIGHCCIFSRVGLHWQSNSCMRTSHRSIKAQAQNVWDL